MVKVIYAPDPIDLYAHDKSIFLAGSIEMGKAEPWQDKVIKMFEMWHAQITIFNPRRPDWDSSWEQKASNPKFREQVLWELNSLEYADDILMYFDPMTKSPISLLEFGLFARIKKLVVVCPKGFWRKGNVDLVCEYYGIKQVSSLAQAVEIMRSGNDRRLHPKLPHDQADRKA